MFDAIVLAGGQALRLGGVDKPAQTVDGITLLSRVVDAVSAAQRCVIVGPRRDPAVLGSRVDVVWAREDPPGSGPMNALRAGLPHTAAPIVFVLPADLPFIAAAIAPLAAALRSQHHVVAAVMRVDGYDNYLAGAWKRAALADTLRRLPRDGRGAVRTLYEQVPTAVVHDPDGWSRDCDTWAELSAARRQAERRRTPGDR